MNEPALLAHDHSALDLALTEVVSALADADAARSFDRLDYFWARLALHIRAENIHLFPALLRAIDVGDEKTSGPGAEEIEGLVARLREDHDFFMNELTTAVKKLRALSKAGQPEGIKNVRENIDAVSRRLEMHNALEESKAYRWATLLLSPAEQTALNVSISRELDNVPPRFRKPPAG
jgi:hypothetical protein